MNIKDSAAHLKNKVHNTYEEGKDTAESTAHHVKETVSDFYEDTKQKACELQHKVSHCSDEVVELVREKPLTSLLIAGGIGFILHALLRK